MNTDHILEINTNWAKIFDRSSEKRFGRYLGVKASGFAAGLEETWCKETEARMTQFFA